MDPNANLQEQEQILRDNAATVGPVPGAQARLRELRAALACWLDAGGFEPAWTSAPRASAYWAARGYVLRRDTRAAREWWRRASDGAPSASVDRYNGRG